MLAECTNIKPPTNKRGRRPKLIKDEFQMPFIHTIMSNKETAKDERSSVKSD